MKSEQALISSHFLFALFCYMEQETSDSLFDYWMLPLKTFEQNGINYTA